MLKTDLYNFLKWAKHEGIVKTVLTPNQFNDLFVLYEGKNFILISQNLGVDILFAIYLYLFKNEEYMMIKSLLDNLEMNYTFFGKQDFVEFQKLKTKYEKFYG